jgi:hypothetical protein
MDFMLEEEMIDILTDCLQDPSSSTLEEKKKRFAEIGKELYNDGGVDAMENFFFAVQNRITEEIGKDPKPFRALWNGIDEEWKY